MMTPFIDRKRQKPAESGSRFAGRTPCCKQQNSPRRQKIFGKNEEEMFAYRKVLEGKSDAARVRDAARAALI
ncbi:hypothetical protein [Paraburkholderia sp. 35.1]|uniref:hypothetical protein n=1 Tax=Paraburkholderia sp. 35.1 TaxID=2991058 RepID=UPI003D1C5D79